MGFVTNTLKSVVKRGGGLVQGLLGKDGTAPTPQESADLPPESTEADPELARDRMRRRARLAYGFTRTNITQGAAATPQAPQKQLLGS